MSTRPNQPQGQGRQNNGGAAGGQLHDVGQKIQDGAAQVGDRLKEGYTAASEHLAHNYRQAEGLMARNPAPSVLVGFGVGFGLGVLLTVLFHEREKESWYDRYVPEGLRDIPSHLRDIPDRIKGMHLPESVARYIPGR